MSSALFADCRAWFAPDTDAAHINQFELYGGTVALDTTDGSITHYISGNAAEPTTQQLLQNTKYYIITPQWVEQCIQSQSLQSIFKYLLPPVIPSAVQPAVVPAAASSAAETLPASVQTAIATTAVIHEERTERYAAQRQKRAAAKRQHPQSDNDSPVKLKQHKAEPVNGTHTAAHAAERVSELYTAEQVIQLQSNVFTNARVLLRPTIPLKSLIPFPTPQSSFTIDHVLPADMFAPVALPRPDVTQYAAYAVVHVKKAAPADANNESATSDSPQIDKADAEPAESFANEEAAETAAQSDTDGSAISSVRTRSRTASAKSTPTKSPVRRKRRKA